MKSLKYQPKNQHDRGTVRKLFRLSCRKVREALYPSNPFQPQSAERGGMGQGREQGQLAAAQVPGQVAAQAPGQVQLPVPPEAKVLIATQDGESPASKASSYRRLLS
jgi:hypothetical protein